MSCISDRPAVARDGRQHRTAQRAPAAELAPRWLHDTRRSLRLYAGMRGAAHHNTPSRRDKALPDGTLLGARAGLALALVAVLAATLIRHHTSPLYRRIALGVPIGLGAAAGCALGAHRTE